MTHKFHHNLLAFFCAFIVAGVCCLEAQDAPVPPQPSSEHQWLQRFVGEWDEHVRIDSRRR